MSTHAPHTNSAYQKMLRTVGVLVLAVVIFVLGAYAGTKKSVAQIIAPGQVATDASIAATAQNEDLSEFWYVWNLMQTKYPFASQIPADKDRVYGAISGMVASYKDPYTIFFPPQQSQLFSDEVKGSFGGVGLEVGMKDGSITVIAPTKGSPASIAGIKSGDVIAMIDGKKTDSMDIDTAISLIRGKVGTVVDIGIARAGAGEIKHYQLTRAVITPPVIDTKVVGDTFVISLYTFSENSGDEFKDALSKFQASGKQKLIIDLRDNPGGYLDDAVDIASYFLPSGTTIVREDSGGSTPEVVDTSKGFTLLSKVPKMAVLINGGSASASEILAGALSENKAATLVGTTSFGKGSVQQVINLPDGSSLKITVAKWLTPNGISISDKGINPDVEVDTPPSVDAKGTVVDPQLDAAVKLLDK